MTNEQLRDENRDYISMEELDDLLALPASSFLAHYGVGIDDNPPGRGSGRYPKGSGENPYQRSKNFIDDVRELKRKGLSETQIAEAFKMTTTQLRARYSIHKDLVKKIENEKMIELRDKGYSYRAIAKEMGLSSDATVRSRLNDIRQERLNTTSTYADYLKGKVGKDLFLDIGSGTENHLGISRTKLLTSVEVLKDEGYQVFYVKQNQMGTDNETTMMVLCPPGTKYQDVAKHHEKIKPITGYSEDYGATIQDIEKPRSVDSKRVAVVFNEEGGVNRDGLIELRRGVPDISMKDARYCQVRIAVDGTHYIKGMAIYSDDLPPGIDIRFNTNKHVGTPLMGEGDNTVFKPIKKDPTNPFGSTIRGDNELIKAQRHYIDENGDKQLSALNIVYEEGNWKDWKKSISSQVLSKQPDSLAKKQLNQAYQNKLEEYEEIMSLTNPIVKQHLLESFADDCDSAAVHLKAAGLPRQASHVILPFNSIKDNEIYAPNYRDGERVVLIRYPHGGKFEIPELIVNNKNKEARAAIGNAKDAVGINHTVAERLSGADFDGDSVLVIPNNSGAIKTAKPLEGLKDFDPKERYPKYEGMPVLGSQAKQLKMGDVTNLITDMTIKGASPDEICKAVKHSMVIIDAEKHELNYKQSYVDNDIRELKKKYQGVNDKGQLKGASTLISRASSEFRRPVREEGEYRTDPVTGKTKKYYIDPETGKKLYTPTGETYTIKKVNPKTGEVTYKEYPRLEKTTKMEATDDARTLSSGTRIEEIYADHANKLKALGNESRKRAVAIKNPSYSPSANKVYSAEVASLMSKLNLAIMNRPLERQAHIIAEKIFEQAYRDNPAMDKDDKKKLKGRALNQARARIGAKKPQIDITPKEWEAIQAGAISSTKLKTILANTDLDKIKQYSMPRNSKGMSASKISRARNLLARDYTQAEVADQLGVSVSTLVEALGL